MAEHVFVSTRVEEFFNSCHSPGTGRFCGGKGKGRSLSPEKQALVSKASNTIKYKNTDNHANETRTSKAALDLTRKYGGRQSAPKKSEKQLFIERMSNKISHKNTDNHRNETRTSAEVLRLTKKYGGR